MVSTTSRLSIGECLPDGNEVLSTFKRAALLGVAALGTAVTLDLVSQRTLWRNSSTEIRAASASNAVGSELRWLAVPGLGQPDGRFIAEDLQGSIPGVVDYARLSDRGLSGKRFGRALAEYFVSQHEVARESVPSQHLLLHSMGLPTYLMGVEWCRKHGITVPPIGVMMAFSSPMNAKQTFAERQIKLMAKYPYPGGALSKLVFEFYQRHDEQKFKMAELGRSALGALKASYSDCSPALWSSQIRTIADRDSYAKGIFEGVITPQTKVIHFGDENDRTVNVPEARRELSQFVVAHGASLIVVDTPGAGHANIPETKHYVSQLLAEVL